MKTVHKRAPDHRRRLDIAIELFAAALEKNRVPPQEQREFLQIIHDMRHLIVEGA